MSCYIAPSGEGRPALTQNPRRPRGASLETRTLVSPSDSRDSSHIHSAPSGWLSYCIRRRAEEVRKGLAQMILYVPHGTQKGCSEAAIPSTSSWPRR